MFALVCFIFTLLNLSVIYIIYRHSKKKLDIELTKISFKESLDLTGLPIATFYNNNQKINLVLDTGCEKSLIDKTFAENLILTMSDEQYEVNGIEGVTELCDLCSIDLSYKNNKFKGLFLLKDFCSASRLMNENRGVVIHGLIGNEFFEKYKYVLDFNDHTAYSKV